MRRNAILICFIMLVGTLPLALIGISSATEHTVSVSADGYEHFALGQINQGQELSIDYDLSGNVDVLLLNQEQFNQWSTGGTQHIESGSDYDDKKDDYIFTIDESNTYHLIFDNSQQAGEASSSGSTITGTATTSLLSPEPDRLRTRTWAGVGSSIDILAPEVEIGEIISISVHCDIGLTSGDDLDFLLRDSVQKNAPGAITDWNRHASFEDTCSYSWEYETNKESSWFLTVDNSDTARTDGLSNGVMVDVVIEVRSLIPLIEVVDTSRMIDSGDYYRVDIGYMPADGVAYIDFSFWSHGTAMLTDDLDVLVMESTEANLYESGNDATALGHTTILDATSQSWSYQFAESGTYSVIFDNTDEPDGGAGDGSDIQVEIGVTSLTIPSLFGNIWTGWHQSRHYTDEGGHLALDLGTLSSGEDVYYYIDGSNEGGSIFSAKEFDIMFMTKVNYDLYVNGSSTFTALQDGTNYKEGGIIPTIENISIVSNDHYMLVMDAADGPNSNAADENGDWIWEFIVLSDGGPIENLQSKDGRYLQSLSIDSISAPDNDNDGVRNGLDECQSTSSGMSVDATGCSNSESDSDGDGVTNNNDQCPNSAHGVSVDTTGCVVVVVADEDGDGVNDEDDQCANTPAGTSVDTNGCASSQLDSDNDGVTDNNDQCANTPAGTSVDTNGCASSQLDSDNDGVTDNNDQCANTPAGTSVDTNGCAVVATDSDGDGVNDEDDQCANTPAGTSVDTNGCASSQLDSDNDGVTDNNDQCANTPAGTSVDTNGCAVVATDSDGDGVNDEDDQCANTPAGTSVDTNGCAVVATDSDGDGVNDEDDQCANTPAGTSVDTNGCAVVATDSDGDGVNDTTDQCSNTPTGANADSTGCSASQKDGDGDGVMNDIDECLNTPAGESVLANGCVEGISPNLDNDENSDDSDKGLPGFTAALATLAFMGAALIRRD